MASPGGRRWARVRLTWSLPPHPPAGVFAAPRDAGDSHPLPAEKRAGAGLTSKPRHAQRPTVALRGSFRPRLASTTEEDPRATTDPDVGPFEDRHAASERATPRIALPRRISVRTTAPRRRNGRFPPRSTRGHRRTPRVSRPSSAHRRRAGLERWRADRERRRRLAWPRAAPPRRAGPEAPSEGSAERAVASAGRVRAPPRPRWLGPGRIRARLGAASTAAPTSPRRPRGRRRPQSRRRTPWRRRASRRTSAGGSLPSPHLRIERRRECSPAARADIRHTPGRRSKRDARTGRTTEAQAERASPDMRYRMATAPLRSRRIAWGTRSRALQRAYRRPYAPGPTGATGAARPRRLRPSPRRRAAPAIAAPDTQRCGLRRPRRRDRSRSPHATSRRRAAGWRARPAPRR